MSLCGQCIPLACTNENENSESPDCLNTIDETLSVLLICGDTDCWSDPTFTCQEVEISMSTIDAPYRIFSVICSIHVNIRRFCITA